MEYHPRKCSLCSYDHIFNTRIGLNNHSTKQHSRYYSLQGNCFIPLGEADLRMRMQKIRASLSRTCRTWTGVGYGPEAAFCPACPLCKGVGAPQNMLQAVQSGLLPMWLRPQLPALDVYMTRMAVGISLCRPPLLVDRSLPPLDLHRHPSPSLHPSHRQCLCWARWQGRPHTGP